MKIKKVKLTKDDRINIAYVKANQDEYSFTSSERARPPFYAAMADLAKHVIEMCELPPEYLERIKVKGVTFSYGAEEAMGATITAQMKLENSNCDLNLNTPHKPSEPCSEDVEVDARFLLSEDCVKDLYALWDEALLYIQGERAQQRLFAM